MVYSRKQEQLAAWIWMILMAAVGSLGVRHTARAVGDIFRLGLSIGTGSIFLLVGGIALIGLSNAVVALLLILFPLRSGKSSRWFLVALDIGVVMIIIGTVGVFK